MNVKGVKGAITEYSEEHEYLLPRNQIVILKDVKNNIAKILLVD
ncbi:hypothetical protein [Methanobrevibacter sp.]|nr:hypothetical protein [Methanobrevibacter sp.]MDO5824355.1 hypothetical protein [Methanobrevibacter sp.]